MNDEFDARLRDRLDRLAAAVPVLPASRDLDVRAEKPKVRGRAQVGALATVALLLIVVAGSGLLGGGRGGGGEAIGSMTDGVFTLTIRSPKDHYRAGEAIMAEALVEYVGGAQSIDVWSTPDVVGFGVEQVGGPHRVAPAFRLSCRTFSFARGQAERYPFVKSGGFSPQDPDADWIGAYFNVSGTVPNPTLYLPAGTWHIFAVTDVAEGGCGGAPRYTLRAAITIVVDGSDASNPEPSTLVAPTPTSAPLETSSPTLPPAGVPLPYPDGCAAYHLSERRCAYIVAWAKTQAGIGDADSVTIELLGDPACKDGQAQQRCDFTRAGGQFVVRVRITPAVGSASEQSVFCGIWGQYSLLCTDTPEIRISSPTMGGYRDVPCSGDPPVGCATPLPTVEPIASVAAQPLDLGSLRIPIDHVGSYAIPVGEAVLPNGILSEAVFGLVDDMPSDILMKPGAGMFLTITSLEGGPAFDNYYMRGWHAGTERVQVTLTFDVEWFRPGAMIEATGIQVH